MKKKALIAMSGGVDSSVCAYLAQKKGYDCMGATMLLCNKEESCSDARDAAAVCQKLNIPHYTFDMTEEFQKKVVEKFVADYEAGATPNPCIECNRYLKFGMLFEKARELGCDVLVTGHYARIDNSDGEYKLLKANDASKDQSYVLYSIPRDMLEHIYFPLGEITKSEARKIAEDMNFVTAHKSDSQDICFVPDGDYASVISQVSLKDYPEGNFVDVNSNVLGTHKGIIRYTVGQRKGLGIAFGKPMYVKEKRVLTNEVVLGSNEELFSDRLVAKDCNFLVDFDRCEIHAKAKIRYNQKEQSARIFIKEDNIAEILFDEPQRAIAKGQAVVIYDEDRVLGGGTIV